MSAFQNRGHSQTGKTQVAMLKLALVLVSSLGMTGCLWAGTEDNSGDDNAPSETTTFSEGDAPGSTTTTSSDGDASSDTGDETGEDVVTVEYGEDVIDDIPVYASIDTVAHSNEIVGAWRCCCIVEEGEEAFLKEITMPAFPTLLLAEDGSGTMDSAGVVTSLTWSDKEDLARIDQVREEGTPKAKDDVSGQAWITRNGMMLWHVDGKPDDEYTLWVRPTDTETAPDVPSEPAPDAIPTASVDEGMQTAEVPEGI